MTFDSRSETAPQASFRQFDDGLGYRAVKQGEGVPLAEARIEPIDAEKQASLEKMLLEFAEP